MISHYERAVLPCPGPVPSCLAPPGLPEAFMDGVVPVSEYASDFFNPVEQAELGWSLIRELSGSPLWNVRDDLVQSGEIARIMLPSCSAARHEALWKILSDGNNAEMADLVMERSRNVRSPTLHYISGRIAALTQTRYDMVAVNLYRDQHDFFACHVDTPGVFREILTASFLGPRPVQMRRLGDPKLGVEMRVEPGSLYRFSSQGMSQYMHGVPVGLAGTLPRLSLTFLSVWEEPPQTWCLAVFDVDYPTLFRPMHFGEREEVADRFAERWKDGECLFLVRGGAPEMEAMVAELLARDLLDLSDVEEDDGFLRSKSRGRMKVETVVEDRLIEELDAQLGPGAGQRIADLLSETPGGMSGRRTALGAVARVRRVVNEYRRIHP